MKKIVKLIAIVLAICSFAFVFVACGDKEKDKIEDALDREEEGFEVEEVYEVSDPRRIEPLMQVFKEENLNCEITGEIDLNISLFSSNTIAEFVSKADGESEYQKMIYYEDNTKEVISSENETFVYNSQTYNKVDGEWEIEIEEDDAESDTTDASGGFEIVNPEIFSIENFVYSEEDEMFILNTDSELQFDVSALLGVKKMIIPLEIVSCTVEIKDSEYIFSIELYCEGLVSATLSLTVRNIGTTVVEIPEGLVIEK